MGNKTAALQYMPQLDALRAIAVILVIIGHWFSEDHFLNRYTANGILGVTLFFVLSGFLITNILLANKAQAEEGAPRKILLKIFYFRRALRIFPVYYLLLLILLVANIGDIRDTFVWHFFYASNFFFWLHGFSGHLSHLWSLAVEEQFYIIWPAIILFVPVKYLRAVFITGIICAVLFRYFITVEDNGLGRLLMPGSLDSFCIGGIIAFEKKFKQQDISSKKRGLLKIIIAVILLILSQSSLFRNLNFSLYNATEFLVISIAFGLIIETVSCTIQNKQIAYILNNKLLLYIGKISYGIYLFHNFIPTFYGLKLPIIPEALMLYFSQGLRFCVLLMLASVSWHILEKPILMLKDKFRYTA